MRSRTMVRVAILLIFFAIGAVGVMYLSSVLYFVSNKVIPPEIHFDTWLRYWEVYADHTVQRGRLIGAGVVAMALVYVVPVIAVANAMNRERSLHGDARWATESEIRKAGLL